MVGKSTDEARALVRRFLINTVCGIPLLTPRLRSLMLRSVRMSIGNSKISSNVKFFGNSLVIGDNVAIGKGVRFYSEATITINDGAIIGNGVTLDTRLTPELRPSRECWAVPIEIPRGAVVPANTLVTGSDFPHQLFK